MLEKTRNAILSDVKRMSYQLVADRYGLTRSTVAGIVWRAKNSLEDRKAVHPKGNRCGRGRHGPGEHAPMTAATHR